MTFFTQRTGLSRALMIFAVVLGGGALFLGSRSANAANASVSIADFSFTPASVTVNVGDTVTWTNTGVAPHTVTSDTGTELASTNLTTGQTYPHTFTVAGTYAYHCSIHPQMTGTVIVTGAAATATSTTAATATATATATNTATATPTGGTSTPTATATATSVPPTATSTPRPPTATAVPATATAAASPAPAAPRTGTTPPPSSGGSSLQIILLGVAGVLGIAGVGLALAKRRI